MDEFKKKLYISVSIPDLILGLFFVAAGITFLIVALQIVGMTGEDPFIPVGMTIVIIIGGIWEIISAIFQYY